MNRPRLISVVLPALIAAALVLSIWVALFLRAPTEPVATATPIKHVIVIMKENHAFDNYFGTFPGVDGIPPNVKLPDGRGGFVEPHWLNGSSTPDLPHSRGDMIEAYNGGLNDMFAVVAERWGVGFGNYSLGYFDNRQIPAYWSLASRFVIADRYFQSILGPSIPNRLYSLAGQSGGLLTNDIPSSGVDIPTIFDQLEVRKISWTYYYSEHPMYPPLPSYFPRLRSNPEMMAKLVPVARMADDIRAGNLPAVAIVDPEAVLEISEHPPANITVGERWTMEVINEIMAGPQWPSSVIFLTWDESGGYFDHVPPPQIDELGYGFRVPLIVASPFARAGWTNHEVLDHTSILKFIARNWNLPNLTERQARANDLLSAFEFQAGGNLSRENYSGVAPGSKSVGAAALELEEGVLPQAIPRVFPREGEIQMFQDLSTLSQQVVEAVEVHGREEHGHAD